MSREHRSRARQYVFVGLSLLLGVLGWGLLLRGDDLPAGFFWGQWALFVLFSFGLKVFGSRVVPHGTHSLVGIVDLAAILLFGPLGGAWIVGSGALSYQIVRGLSERIRPSRARKALPFPLLIGSALFDSSWKIIVAWCSGQLYLLLGGQIPLQLPDLAAIWPVLPLFPTWFLLDHLGWALAEFVLGGIRGVREWFRAMIIASLLIELFPLPISLLVAVVYVEQAGPAFYLLCLSLFGTGIVIQQLVAIVQEQRRSTRELAQLNEVATAIVQAELSVERLCELIYEQASRVVDTSTFHLGLFEGDLFTLHILVREGVRQEPISVQLSPGQGIIGWMLESKKSLLVRDFPLEMDSLPARPIYVSDQPSRSGIFVPLIARGEVIGSLSIQSRQANVFTEQHRRILSFIAEQSSLAIEKARLYQAAQDRAVELERAAEENASLYAQVREDRDRLELLYDVTRDLTQRLDTEDLLQRLLQRTAEILHAPEGTILLLGSGQGLPHCISLRGDDCRIDQPSHLEAVLEQGLAGWVVRQRQGALIPDAGEDERWLPVDWPVGAVIAAPIPRGESAWGAITLTHPEVGFFTEADMTLLQAISEQASVALEAAHLYESQRRRVLQLQTISQVMRRILSILDLDDLLDEVVHMVRERFGYAHVHLFTLGEGEEEVVFRASTDMENPFWAALGGRLPLGEGLVGWTARQGKPVVVGDVREDERWLPDEDNVGSEIAVPLKVAGEVVGVLDVQSEDLNAFDGVDHFILQTLADQLAVALEQARLYASQQEEAWVLNALLQVARNIAQVRDLDEMLEVVVRLVPLLVGVEHCALFLRERRSGELRAVQSYGLRWDGLKGLRFDPETVPSFQQVVRQASPLALIGLEERQSFPPALSEALGEGGVWLFPLIVGGEVSSVLLLGLAQRGDYLSDRQHTILTGIAHQAGIAIEESRLRLEETEHQRLEQELAVARDIQQRLLPEHPPETPGWSIEVAWQAARQVGGDFYDFIQLPDGRLGVVIADVSDKGMPAALIMTLTRSLMQAGAVAHTSPAEALIRTNDLLLRDTQAEMFVSLFYAVVDLDSGRMTYASAGHNPPLLCRGDDGQIESLEAPGIILGVIEEPHIEDRHVRMEPGDTLVLYTDGITESINLKQEDFGEERLRQIVCDTRGQDLAAVRRTLLSALEEFCQGQPPFDDVTLVLVRRELD